MTPDRTSRRPIIETVNGRTFQTAMRCSAISRALPAYPAQPNETDVSFWLRYYAARRARFLWNSRRAMQAVEYFNR